MSHFIHSFIFCSTFALSTLATKAYSSDHISASAWRETKETAYPTLCDKHQIELFSCPDKSRHTIALCMTRKDELISFVYRQHRIKKSIQLNSIQRAMDSPSNGPSTILQAETGKGLLRFYLDENSSDSDENYPGVVTLNGKVAFACIHDQRTYRTPTYIIKSKQGEDDMVNLWHIKFNAFFEKEQKDNPELHEDKMYDLWGSWPE